MITVVIESPYAADTAAGVARNMRYARACMAYCIANDAAPFASHLLYTQPGVLNDKDPAERKNGMRAGFAVAAKLQERWFFIDLGMTDGMLRGEEAAAKMTPPQKTRRISLPDWESNHVREALIDRVWSGLISRAPSAPARDVVAAWSDEDLEQVTVWLNLPEDYTKSVPACLLVWARGLATDETKRGT
jgi:hypothetical protein